MARAAWYSFWVLGVLAAIGGIELRRRRSVPVFPLLVPPVMVVLTVALTYFSTRFRASAEVAICLLAAVAVDAVLARRWQDSSQWDEATGATEITGGPTIDTAPSVT